MPVRARFRKDQAALQVKGLHQEEKLENLRRLMEQPPMPEDGEFSEEDIDKYVFGVRVYEDRFAVTVPCSFLLLLLAGISLKTWPCSRKIQAGRRASQTGINSTSAMRVLLVDVAVDQ